MAKDAVFRLALVWLATLLVLVGLCTHSFKKMLVTYVFGVFAIAGVLLPDWDFFDRDFSKWCSPVDMNDSTSFSIWKRSLFLFLSI